MLLLYFKAFVGTQYLGRASAGNDGSELSPELHPSGHFIDQLSHRYRADFDLKVTGTDYVAANANNPGAGIAGPAKSRILRAAHRNDMLHVTERFDVVHDGRTHVEAQRCGEVRRFDPRIRALAFERFDQPRFLTANVGAGAAMNEDFHIKMGTENILTQKFLLPRFLDGALEDLRALGKFAPYIYVSGVDIEGITGNQDTLEQLVRILVNDVAVLERSGFRFVRVANQIHRLLLVRFDKAPLHPGRETGATASAQRRSLNLVKNVRPRHGNGLLQLFVAAVIQVTIDVGRPIRTADVFENKPVFERMR